MDFRHGRLENDRESLRKMLREWEHHFGEHVAATWEATMENGSCNEECERPNPDARRRDPHGYGESGVSGQD